MTTDKAQLLDLIDDELSGIPHRSSTEIGGHKYELELLNRGDESFAKSLLPPDNLAQVLADQATPILAVALRSIDDVPVEELFTKITPEELKELGDDADSRRRHMCGQIIGWLNKKPSVFTQQMYILYLDMKSKAREALEALGPLSKTTPSST